MFQIVPPLYTQMQCLSNDLLYIALPIRQVEFFDVEHRVALKLKVAELLGPEAHEELYGVAADVVDFSPLVLSIVYTDDCLLNLPQVTIFVQQGILIHSFNRDCVDTELFPYVPGHVREGFESFIVLDRQMDVL